MKLLRDIFSGIFRTRKQKAVIEPKKTIKFIDTSDIVPGRKARGDDMQAHHKLRSIARKKKVRRKMAERSRRINRLAA